MSFNIPDSVNFEVKNHKVKFSYDDFTTSWISQYNGFCERIDKCNLNPFFEKDHIIMEFKIRNILDEGISLLKMEKYQKAIDKFDEVLFYDESYGEALLNKSFALKGQKHYVKSLRHYKKAVKADACLKDNEYHMNLLKLANAERDNFPKFKLSIYVGDEYFSKGDFKKAIESYDKALVNPSKFREKILSKLLNKKATSYLRLGDYENALECFTGSCNAEKNDYAVFGRNVCLYEVEKSIDCEFRGLLKINKKQMLKQISILNNLGFFNESLIINDYLWRNHFRIDDFYRRLASQRRFSMKNLNRDLSELDDMDL